MKHIREIVETTEKAAVAHIITLSGQSFTLGVVAPNAGPVLHHSQAVRRAPRSEAVLPGDLRIGSRKQSRAEVPEAFSAAVRPAAVARARQRQRIPGDGGRPRRFGAAALARETQHLRRSRCRRRRCRSRRAPVSHGCRPKCDNRRKLTAAKAAPSDRQLEPTADEKKLLDIAHQKLKKVFTIANVNYPQLFADVNRDQCQTMGLNMNDVYDTLQIYLGSLYVNDFNRFGRTWEVVVQADAKFRNRPEDVRRLQVRNAAGNDGAARARPADVRLISGPLVVTRYNLYPASAIQGEWPPDVSSGEAISALENLADAVLPPKMKCEWTEITYLQLIAENTGMVIFGLAVLLVFLVLAAQYESWSLPLAIILVVPMCMLSAIIGVWLTHSDINIFTQIGFVVLVGLASKNAVLIVEFAKHKRETGMSRREATLEACRLAFAADLDDFVRVHPRRRAAGVVDRRGIRDAARAGRGRVQRHAGRDVLRHLAHARVLLRHRLGRHRRRRSIRIWLTRSIACCSAC